MVLFQNANGLSSQQFEFYGRQLILPEIGVEGQKKLLGSRVTVIGAGGLGSPACLYLAGAGIGHLKIVDGDTVELSNLQRQIIHSYERQGQNKAESAAYTCGQFNHMTNVEVVPEYATQENISSILRGSRVVVDATDNARDRYLINAACCAENIPLVFGSALRWEGQVIVFYPSLRGPCYSCLFPHPPKENNGNVCEMQGVVGVAPGVIGVLQASEAIKLCLGMYDACLLERMFIFDALSREMMGRTVKIRSLNPDCVVCTGTLKENLNVDCPDATYPILPLSQIILPIDLFRHILTLERTFNDERKEQVERLAVRQDVKDTCYLIDVRPENHFNALHIDGSINIPLDTLRACIDKDVFWREKDNITLFSQEMTAAHRVYCICRKGRDASKATLILLSIFKDHYPNATPQVACVKNGFWGLQQTVPQLRDFPRL